MNNIFINKHHLSAFAKFRCEVPPIRLETGRYEYLPVEQCLCPMSDSKAIESEIHVLTKCNLYIYLRTDLFHRASSVNNDFNNFTYTQKFIFLMTNAEVITQTAKTCLAILCKKHSFLYSN